MKRADILNLIASTWAKIMRRLRRVRRWWTSLSLKKRRMLLLVLIVLSALPAAIAVASSNVAATLEFDNLEMTNVDDFNSPTGEDFNIAADVARRLTQIELRGKPIWTGPAGSLDGVSLSIPDKPRESCTTLRVTTDLRRTGADRAAVETLVGLVPAGADGCTLLVQFEGTSRDNPDRQEIRSGELLTLHTETVLDGEPLTLFERVQTMQIAGKLSGGGASDNDLGCRGDYLKELRGSHLRLRKVALSRANPPKIVADVSVGRLTEALVDERSCYWAFIWRVAVKWGIRDLLWKIIPAITTFVLGVVLGRRKRGSGGNGTGDKNGTAKKEGSTCTSVGILVLVIASLAPGCMAQAQAQSKVPGRRVLVATAWIDCKTRKEDSKLRSGLAGKGESLAKAIATIARDVEVVVLGPNPSRDDLLGAIRASRGPLWFVYSGHGQIAHKKSVVCLPDADVGIEEMIEAVPAQRTTVAFWIDACYSATASVKRPGTSLFSASSVQLSTEAFGTPVLSALLGVLADSAKLGGAKESDCGRPVTDQALFDAVVADLPKFGIVSLESGKGTKPARPKLRRQSWTPIPLFEKRSLRPGCDREMALSQLAAEHRDLKEILKLEIRYRAGEVVTAQDELPPVVWAVSEEMERGKTEGKVDGFEHSLGQAEARRISEVLLVPRFLLVSGDGKQVVVNDLQSGQQLWTGQSIPEAGSISAFEGKLMWTPADERRAVGGNVEWRYYRPIRTREIVELDSQGFIPCPCEKRTGHCYCKSGAGLGGR
jgi:hypothetical protein